MKRIIGGKRYDTDRSEKIAEAQSKEAKGDPRWWEEALYRSPGGQLFL